MTVEDLKSKLEDNYSILGIEEEYKKYLNRHNRIPNLGFSNRLLVHIQNALATDVRPETIWNMAGRKLKPDFSPIFILIPQYKTHYVYAKTGEKLRQADLTSDELSKAVKIGFVIKQSEVAGYSVSILMDVRDTIPVKEGQDNYKLNLPNIKLSKLLLECCKYRPKAEMKHTIDATKSPEDKLVKLSGILLENLLETEYPEEIREFIKDSVIYSILSYCEIEYKVKFDSLQDLIEGSRQDEETRSALFSIFEKIEELTYYILGTLGFKHEENEFGDDIYTQIDTIKKSDSLLSVLESNEVRMNYSARFGLRGREGIKS